MSRANANVSDTLIGRAPREAARVIEHQAVGMMLAEMRTRLEAARALVVHAAELFDAGDRSSPFQQMAKWFAAETAVQVCQLAMEVLAHRGIMMDEPVQKYMRDCLSFLHSDGTQQAHLMRVQQAIIDGRL